MAYTIYMNPTEKIDQLIESLTDWRGPALSTFRRLFHEVDPLVVEEWKWMGTPCWYHDGLLAAGMAFKTSVKLGFWDGASLPDPDHVFNDELKGNKRRAIKLYENDPINEEAIKKIILAAIEFNKAKKK